MAERDKKAACQLPSWHRVRALTMPTGVRARFLGRIASALCAANAVTFVGLWLTGRGFPGGSLNLWVTYLAQNALSLAIAVVAAGAFLTKAPAWSKVLGALA